MHVSLDRLPGAVVLRARGPADRGLHADLLVEAVTFLPAGAQAILDLREVTDLSPETAQHLRRALCSRLADDVVPVIVSDDERVRLHLVLADIHHLVPVVFTLEQATTCLPVQVAA